jgi:hypothetical protein
MARNKGFEKRLDFCFGREPCFLIYVVLVLLLAYCIVLMLVSYLKKQS